MRVSRWTSLCFVCFAVLPVKSIQAATPDDSDPKLPQHELVCANGVVSKRQLATTLFVDYKNYDAVIAVSRGPELWHTIFTDDNFCSVPSSCSKSPDTDACKAAAKCTNAKSNAFQAARRFFIAVNTEKKKPDASYIESGRLAELSQKAIGDQVTLYFSNPNDSVDPIRCTEAKVRTPQPGFDPSKDAVLSKIRVRGLSDDLYVDRALPAFKATTPATGTYTADSSAGHTTTLKATGAIGYAFDSIPQTQIVPYFSFYQSFTDTLGKPTTLDANDNMAAGILLQSYFDYAGVSHVFSIKPQFLQNTSSEAEISSVRATYAPWMDIPFNINTFRQLDSLPGSPWGEIMFNLRSDSGSYSNRGNTPAIVATNRDFERAGAQIGFTLTTDGVANVPSLTLIVTETYLYGFSGYYRTMDLFQASLTYNIINTYVGLTANYKKGRDEDTAVASQVWTVGLSAHY
jgi:hypothetical protein